jgi:hypothetical protein
MKSRLRRSIILRLNSCSRTRKHSIETLKYVPLLTGMISTGGNRVFIFDHTIRRATVDERTAGGQRRGPGRRVHIDQSYDAAVSRVRHHLPEEADELLKKRFNLINVSTHSIPLSHVQQSNHTHIGLAPHQNNRQRPPSPLRRPLSPRIRPRSPETHLSGS